MEKNRKTGILLINTGSPDAPEVRETRAYLRQFLSDARVIDMAPLLRWLLLNFVILPRRPKESSKAYKSIWTERGSPLIVNSADFAEGLQRALPDAVVKIGMAYGRPTVPESMQALIENNVDRIVVVPMFPQYASATAGSVLELTYKTAASMMNVPPLTVLPPFYQEPEFLDAWAGIIQPHLSEFKPDHVVMSFHGLPERHIHNCDPTGNHCLKSADCCERYLEANPNCYRAHCLATASGVAARCGLGDSDYTLAFQSKLGRDAWLTPATDATLVSLAQKGVKRLAVISPAFVADCIETTEELGMQGKESFLSHGGQDFLLVPSLNADAAWIDGFAALLNRSCLGATPQGS